MERSVKQNPSLQLTAPGTEFDGVQKLGLAAVGVGLAALLVAFFGVGDVTAFFWFAVAAVCGGGLVYFFRTHRGPAGVRNDDRTRSPILSRGAVGWTLGVVLTAFYCLLYWVDGSMDGLIRATEGFSQSLRGRPSDKWFVYGLFYTLAVALMGVRALLKYRHSRYQIIRTLSVVFFQAGFGFIVPGILLLLNEPEFYFHYFWPLKYDYLWPGTVGYLMEQPGALGTFMVFWGGLMILVATPVLTYFFGKRWYCSWVCGCGALAETAGDEFRQLSDKSLKAWKFERWSIHLALAIVTAGTLLLWVNSALGGWLLGGFSNLYAQFYGFVFGLVWAGVIGVGFYPLMGTRVWCRFGCPMAAILGLIQRYYSRFRITTNGGQCISCGNCSKYCEMGIDVRWYAQRGQNIVRASCVGCGMCADVCPRGVLRLENGPLDGRLGEPGSIAVAVEDVDILPS
jgi:Pyruvate/2-oxoacid:ferredoxin oxidoreductase delta subunit